MKDLDESIRQLVRTIGDAAPKAPPLHEAPQGVDRRFGLPGPIVAVVSFAAVVVMFIGLRVVLGGGAVDPSNVATDESVAVRHQVVEFIVVAELSCEDAIGSGTSTVRLETWADFTGRRFRQHAIYQDGSTRDLIVLGDLNYPTQTYGMGDPQLPSPACGGDMLGGDPTGGTHIVFFNSPLESPNTVGYKELGIIVPGTHVDNLGRPAVLYRETIDGLGTFSSGVEYAIHQVTEWFVNPSTGDVLETVSAQQGEGQYDVRETRLVVSDDTIDLDAAVFDLDGFQLEWDSNDALGPQVDGDPVSPSLSLGTTAIWPQPLEPDGPDSVAARFAAEVLGWDNPAITLDPEAANNAPTWITLNDGQGHELTMLAAPSGTDGWGLIQIGNPPSLGSGPLGAATISPASVANATQLMIHAATLDGTILAWKVDLSDQPNTIVLNEIQIGEVKNLLIIYRDSAGNTLRADGGQHGTP